MSNVPIVDRIRIIPRPSDFLDRNVGSSGEVFYSKDTNSLRVYSGKNQGGFEIAKADLTNITDAVLQARLDNLNVGGGGNTSITVSATAPQDAEQGQLWFDTDSGVLFVYYDEWVQPSSSGQSGGAGAGSYTNANVDTHLNVGSATAGQVLSWTGSDYDWVANSGSGVGEANQNAFSNIAVSGQTTVTADNTTDTLTLVAGSNITLTTSGNTVTITGTASGGGSTDFGTLTDVTTANLTIDKIYEPAIVMLRVDNVGVSAYTFGSHYPGQNPTIYALAGTTIAFDLDQINGHPFELQDPTSTPLTANIVHVSSSGVVSTGANAQGKSSGTLYWRIPESISGTYRYQCQSHASMVGGITIKRLSVI